MTEMPPLPPLTLIVAVTAKNGIGKNGGLPWPMLKKEMAYFARVTKRVQPTPSSPQSADSASARNVVVMGRKTWDSIPPKFRPLAQRTNLVISTQDTLPTISQALLDSGDVVLAKDIASGLASLAQRAQNSAGDSGGAQPLGRVFVIGGSTIYRTALQMQNARHVLLTRVGGEWDCDTQFPVDFETSAKWVRRDQARLSEFVGEDVGAGVVEEEVKGEKIGYEFRLYERVD